MGKPLIPDGPMTEDAARAQTEALLERLLGAYGQFLRGTLRRMMPRQMGISLDDLEQDVRVRLWRALETEREIVSPSSYLYRIAATATLDAVRKARTRRREVPLDDREEGGMWAAESGGVGTSRFVASGDDPATAAARAQMLERIDRARRSLVPPRDEAVGLHLQGFTTREIGGLLGWTEPKARNLVYRGLAELKTAMGNEGVELEADEE